MPQSLSRVLVHVVFSTGNRLPLLSPDLRQELFPYLAVALTESGCPALRVGGVSDHVHLLFGLGRNTPVAAIVESIKTSSSKWIKTKEPHLRSFRWQRGYGAFSVGESGVEPLIRYIQNQERHHRHLGFQDEFRGFLRRYNLAWDERYLWD